MYKELKINFEIPEILDRNIKEFVDDLNNNNGNMADCYTEEIRSLLNGCDTCLTYEQIRMLRDYYYGGGIYGSKNA